MQLFHWGLILRYTVYGVLPLVVFLELIERYAGSGLSEYIFLALAFLLPFVAISWLAFQHFRHRKK